MQTGTVRAYLEQHQRGSKPVMCLAGDRFAANATTACLLLTTPNDVLWRGQFLRAPSLLGAAPGRRWIPNSIAHVSRAGAADDSTTSGFACPSPPEDAKLSLCCHCIIHNPNSENSRQTAQTPVDWLRAVPAARSRSGSFNVFEEGDVSC